MNSNPSILIIDDDPLVRETIESFLDTAGYNHDSAPDGAVGVEMMKSSPFDLVITDILMPNKEGMETIMELKREHPDTRIIAISGQGWSGAISYLDMAKQLGADTALSKPFSKSDLLETITKVLSDDD